MCSDPKKVWHPQRNICYAEMEEAAARRRYAEIHEALPFHDGTFSRWSSEANARTPYHHSDGVDIWVAEVDENPDDHFLDAPQAFESES